MCNGQRRASHDRVRGVIVSGVLVMSASGVMVNDVLVMTASEVY